MSVCRRGIVDGLVYDISKVVNTCLLTKLKTHSALWDEAEDDPLNRSNPPLLDTFDEMAGC